MVLFFFGYESLSKGYNVLNEFMCQSHMRFCRMQWSSTRFYGSLSLRSWRYCVVVEWDLAAEPFLENGSAAKTLVSHPHNTVSYAGYGSLSVYSRPPPLRKNSPFTAQLKTAFRRLLLKHTTRQ